MYTGPASRAGATKAHLDRPSIRQPGFRPFQSPLSRERGPSVQVRRLLRREELSTKIKFTRMASIKLFLIHSHLHNRH